MKSFFNRILVSVALFIVVFFLLGTLIALKTGKAELGENYRNSDPSPSSLAKDLKDFSELGQLRVFCKKEGENVTVVVLTPWLSYASGDKTFYEELVQKKRKIKTIFSDYFSSYTQNELLTRGEENIKFEILQKINAELIFGEISAVYFKDYIFL